MLVDKNIFEKESRVKEIEESFNKIISILKEIDSIEIIPNSRVISTNDISLHNYLQLKKWDFDYISFLNGENAIIFE